MCNSPIGCQRRCHRRCVCCRRCQRRRHRHHRSLATVAVDVALAVTVDTVITVNIVITCIILSVHVRFKLPATNALCFSISDRSRTSPSMETINRNSCSKSALRFPYLVAWCSMCSGFAARASVIRVRVVCIMMYSVVACQIHVRFESARCPKSGFCSFVL